MNTDVLPPQRSTFVSVVAWIFIALAGFVTLISTMQSVMVYLMFSDPHFQTAMRVPPQFKDSPQWIHFFFEHPWIFFVFFWVASLFMLVSAIGLLRRKNWARILFIVVLGFGILWNAGSLVFEAFVYSGFSQLPQETPPDFAAGFKLMATVAVVGSALMGVGLCVLFGWIIQRLCTQSIKAEFRVLPVSAPHTPIIRYSLLLAVAALIVISASTFWRLVMWSPSSSDFSDTGSSPNDTLKIPRAQEEPAVPEVTGDGVISGGVATLLGTSFELAEGEDRTTTLPFVQNGTLPWGRDNRAHSGQMAINVIPNGNPGDLRYFGFDKSISPTLLSSRLSGPYTPFRVEALRRVELEFWRLSTSNPSETHNCLGSLRVDYRVDGGEWQSKMVYCGRHKSKPIEWKRSVLEFDTAGHRELEFRFDYEYPPDTHRNKTAVYLIDDLVVRGYQ